MSHRASITALRFIASFRRAQLMSAGMYDDIVWAEISVDEDGTEEQRYLVLERTEPACDGEAEVQVRCLKNPSSATFIAAARNPQDFWFQAIEVTA